MKRVIIIYEDRKYRVIEGEQLSDISEIQGSQSYLKCDTRTVWITMWENSEKIFRESTNIQDVIIEQDTGNSFILHKPKMWITNQHKDTLEISHDGAKVCTQEEVLEIINQMIDVSEEHDFKFTRLRVTMTYDDFESRPDYYLIEKEFNYVISNDSHICIIINEDIREDYIINTPIQKNLATVTLEDRYGYENSVIQNPKLYVVGDKSIIIGRCTLISK